MTNPPRSSYLVGLIGAGIQASRTPSMHEHEAAEQGLRCEYRLIDLDKLQVGAEALPDLLNEAEASGFAGLNITYPCKQSVLGLLHELSDDARAIGAVNTVVLSGGRRSGHNTDWWGFAEGFRRGLPDVQRDNVVQLGAGGAGAAVAHAALTLGVRKLTIFDLDATRARNLAADLCARFGAGRAAAGTDLGDSDGDGRRTDPRHADGNGEVSRAAVAGDVAAARAVGRGDCLFPAGDRIVARGTPARLPHHERQRHGSIPGGRGFPAVYRHKHRTPSACSGTSHPWAGKARKRIHRRGRGGREGKQDTKE